MAKNPKDMTKAELVAALAEKDVEVDTARDALDAETNAKSTMMDRMTRQGAVGPSVTWSEVMVGIRNISDNTIGLVSPFAHETDVQLFGDVATTHGDAPVGTDAAISYAWWRQLRTQKEVQRGQLVRDDTILGPGITSAPVDRAKDLPESFHVNNVEDPIEWIESRDETQIRDDLMAMTYMGSVSRIRRVVDEKLREIENTQPRETIAQQVVAADYAVRALSGKLRLVDGITTDLILSDAANPKDVTTPRARTVRIT